MQDELDPPRKFYGFKPKEFERVNEPAKEQAPLPTGPDPGVPSVPDEQIDVKELIRIGALGPDARAAKPVASSNEVHAMLQGNLTKERAAGLFHVEAKPDLKRRRRIMVFWIGLAVVDVPLGVFAATVGHEAAIPFVCSIAGIGMFTSWIIWETFFLRTD
jgi:hypothetical protein